MHVAPPASNPQVRIPHLADLSARVGQALGHSEWITIDQDRINRFAEATGDHQWIHVDPVRAAQGPFKTPIAHGFLTLSLLPWMFEHGFEITDVRMGVLFWRLARRRARRGDGLSLSPRLMKKRG